MKLENQHGMIAISNWVIAELAADAAMSCPGVTGMAEAPAREGMVRLLKREQMTKGVLVTSSADGGAACIELHIAASPEANMRQTAEAVIAAVKTRVEGQTGLLTGGITVCVDAVKA